MRTPADPPRLVEALLRADLAFHADEVAVDEEIPPETVSGHPAGLGVAGGLERGGDDLGSGLLEFYRDGASVEALEVQHVVVQHLHRRKRVLRCSLDLHLFGCASCKRFT